MGRKRDSLPPGGLSILPVDLLACTSPMPRLQRPARHALRWKIGQPQATALAPAASCIRPLEPVPTPPCLSCIGVRAPNAIWTRRRRRAVPATTRYTSTIGGTGEPGSRRHLQSVQWAGECRTCARLDPRHRSADRRQAHVGELWTAPLQSDRHRAGLGPRLRVLAEQPIHHAGVVMPFACAHSNRTAVRSRLHRTGTVRQRPGGNAQLLLDRRQEDPAL